MSSPHKTVAFIGGGNMAEAFLGGLVGHGYPSANLRVSEPVEKRREYLQSKFPTLQLVTDNDKAVEGVDIVLFAVKPQVLQPVARALAPKIQSMSKKPLIVTIAAGITISDLSRWLGSTGTQETRLQVIRVMPNTPCLELAGASGLFANEYVDQKEKQAVLDIMKSVNQRVYFVEKESHLDIVTALSGSGPAYFFYFMQHMIEAAVNLGLPADVARGLAAQTCLGASKMVLNSSEDTAVLRKKVTSPNGTTQAAIETMERLNVGPSIAQGVQSAHKRSLELGVEFGKDLN